MAVHHLAQTILWLEIGVLLAVSGVGLGYVASKIRDRHSHHNGHGVAMN
jgi:hypothetical protein